MTADSAAEALIPTFEGPVGAVSAKWSKGTGGPAGDECQNLIAADLRNGTIDDVTPALQSCSDVNPNKIPHILAADMRNGSVGDVTQTLQAAGIGDERGGNPSAIPHILAFDTTQITHPENRSRPDNLSPQLAATSHPPAIAFDLRARGDDGRGYDRGPNFSENLAPSLNTVKPPAIAYAQDVADPITANEAKTWTHEGCTFRTRNVMAFTGKDYGADATEEQSPTLRSMNEIDGNANGGGQVAIAFQTRIGRNGRGAGEDIVPALNGADAGATSDMRPCVAMFKPSHFTRGKDGAPGDIAPPLGAEPDKGDQDAVLFAGAAVRRLTPLECERLQGFPDRYTDVVFRGKPAADGPRYKALGNAMNVAELRWILGRIDRFEREVKL